MLATAIPLQYKLSCLCRFSKPSAGISQATSLQSLLVPWRSCCSDHSIASVTCGSHHCLRCQSVLPGIVETVWREFPNKLWLSDSPRIHLHCNSTVPFLWSCWFSPLQYFYSILQQTVFCWLLNTTPCIPMGASMVLCPASLRASGELFR